MTPRIIPKNKIGRRSSGSDEVAERPTDMGKIKTLRERDTARQTKTSILLSDPDVSRWYDNLARGSMYTASRGLGLLGRFCEMHQMTPRQLADLGMRDVRTVTDLLEDHVTMMESTNYSPGHVANHIKTAKSWLRHFDVEIRRRIRISATGPAPVLENERVPNADEMAEIYSRAGLRESAVISLMAKAGLRPEVIGNYDGTDGLQMRDLPDIVTHRGEAKCARAPCMVTVRRTLSKARHQYFTFLTGTATRQVTAYLNDRIAHGETLHDGSPVISPDHLHRISRGRNSAKAFLPTSRVSKLVRETFRPRFSWRPYVLRAYFDTQLLIAESKGRMAHDFRVFFMGHKGSMEARYTTNKGVLPEVLVSEMRQAFGRSEEHLDQTGAADPLLEQRERAQQMITDATPEQIGRVLEALQVPAICAQTARGR